jgi:hypothetical protein
MINGYFHTLVFDQPKALMRLSLLRILVVGICLIMLAIGPYDTTYHSLFASIMYKARFPFFFFPQLDQKIEWLKIFSYSIGVCALIGYKTKLTLPLFTLSYCLLNYYIHCFQEHYCMNHAHLNVALIVLSLTSSSSRFSVDALKRNELNSTKEHEKASFALTFLGGYIAVLFFQAGLSKLIYGGIGWFLSGDTLYVETIFDGTDLGRFLTRFTWTFPILGIGVFFFELVFPFLFLFYRYHLIFGIILLLFHLGTYLVMGINFWFLWPLYIPLFLMRFSKSNAKVVSILNKIKN